MVQLLVIVFYNCQLYFLHFSTFYILSDFLSIQSVALRGELKLLIIIVYLFILPLVLSVFIYLGVLISRSVYILFCPLVEQGSFAMKNCPFLSLVILLSQNLFCLMITWSLQLCSDQYLHNISFSRILHLICVFVFNVNLSQ